MADGDFGFGLGQAGSSLPTTSTHKMSGSDFAGVFEAEFNPQTSQLVMGGGVSDRIRHERVMELHVRLHQTGWEKATIVNMHPFELRHGMGNIGEMRVPKKKEGEPYYKFTIDKYRISMRDLGDAKFIPQEVVPVEMAKDLCLAYKDYGGVFWYRGTGDPEPEQLEKAYQEQLNFYKRQYESGLDFWARKKQLSLITDHMRNAAKELFRIGAIAQLPEWVTVTRQEAERMMCPSCGEDIKSKAKRCRFCGYFLDAEFASANQSRFGSGSFTPSTSQPVESHIDESKKNIEDFMNEADPEALNHIKNLEAKIASEQNKETEEILKQGAKGPQKNKVHKL